MSEKLSLDCQHLCKTQAWWHGSVNPELDSQILGITSLANYLPKLESSTLSVLPVSKYKVKRQLKETSGCLPLASTQAYTSESNSPPHAHIHTCNELIGNIWIYQNRPEHARENINKRILSIQTSWIHEDMIAIKRVHSLRQCKQLLGRGNSPVELPVHWTEL